MNITDIIPGQGGIDIKAKVLSKGEVRTFEKFGKKGRVCSTVIKDDSGSVKLTLWNEDADKIKIGDRIELNNCYASEYKGEVQLTTGRGGKIVLIESAKESDRINDNEMKDSAPDNQSRNIPDNKSRSNDLKDGSYYSVNPESKDSRDDRDSDNRDIDEEDKESNSGDKEDNDKISDESTADREILPEEPYKEEEEIVF